MRLSTAARFSAIVTPPLHRPSIGAIDSQIRETIRFFVASAQRMPYREIRKVTHETSSFFVQWDEVLVLDAKFSEHLVHQQQRIGNDLHLGRPFFARDRQRFEKSGVLR